MKLYPRAVIISAMMLAGLAQAHHSYAMFDFSRDVVVKGTVLEWDWTNPHTLLVVGVPATQSGMVRWTVEGASPVVLRDKGWNRLMMKPGDKITVHLTPLRDGANGGQLSSVITADGKFYKYR